MACRLIGVCEPVVAKSADAYASLGPAELIDDIPRNTYSYIHIATSMVPSNS